MSTVEHEIKNERNYSRIEFDGVVKFNGSDFTLNDISLNGCSLKAADQSKMVLNDTQRIDIVINFQHFDLKFNANTRIVRKDEKHGIVGFQFLDNDDYRTNTIRELIKAKSSGKLISVDDLTSQKTQKPDENTKHENIQNSAIIIIRYALLALIAPALAIFIGLSLYAMSFTTKADYAAIYKPSFYITSPSHGKVTNINVGDRSNIKKGDDLFTIKDLSIEKELTQLNIELDTLKNKLSRLNDEFDYSTKKVKLISLDNDNKIKYLNSVINESMRKVTLISNRLEKNKRLLDSKYVSESYVEQIEEKLRNEKIKLADYKMQLRESELIKQSIQDGVRYINIDDNDRYPEEIKSDIYETMKNIKQLTIQINNLSTTTATINVVSECNCRVEDIYVNNNQNVERSDNILTLTQHSNYTIIEAYILADKVGDISEGDEVSVQVSDHDDTIDGVVSEVRMTPRNIPHVGVNETLFNKKDYGVVYIRIDKDSDTWDAGMPVQISVTSTLNSMFFHFFGIGSPL